MNWSLYLWVVLAVVVGVGIEASLAKGFKNLNVASTGIRAGLCLIVGGALVYWIDKPVVQTILIMLALLCVYLCARNNLSFKK